MCVCVSLSCRCRKVHPCTHTHTRTHRWLSPWRHHGNEQVSQQEVRRPTLLMQRKKKKRKEKALPARRLPSSSQLSLSSAASVPLVLRLRSCHKGESPAVSLQNFGRAAQRRSREQLILLAGSMYLLLFELQKLSHKTDQWCLCVRMHIYEREICQLPLIPQKRFIQA